MERGVRQSDDEKVMEHKYKEKVHVLFLIRVTATDRKM